ncbi:adenylyltransferase/cytidyltransferase family protein [Nonomuraea ferruginea]
MRESERSVVTIGVFDGVHRGHRQVVRRAVEVARERGLRTVALTFEPPPEEVVRPGYRPLRLVSAKRRSELLRELGVDEVVVLPFTLETAELSPAEFAQGVLADRLRAGGGRGGGRTSRSATRPRVTSRRCARWARSTTSRPRGCRWSRASPRR